MRMCVYVCVRYHTSIRLCMHVLCGCPPGVQRVLVELLQLSKITTTAFSTCTSAEELSTTAYDQGGGWFRRGGNLRISRVRMPLVQISAKSANLQQNLCNKPRGSGEGEIFGFPRFEGHCIGRREVAICIGISSRMYRKEGSGHMYRYI